MKIQTINKIQQRKLLKLCKKFFPDYKHVDIFEHQMDVGGPAVNDVPNTLWQWWLYLSNMNVPHDDGIWLHWYQLCLTELPKRIYNNINFPSVSLFDLSIYNGESLAQKTVDAKHPVDFLWDFVKTCEKNNYFYD